MNLRAYIASIALLLCSCVEELPAESTAGFVASHDGRQIAISPAESPSKPTLFEIDEQTIYQGGELLEGNIVEILYRPIAEGERESEGKPMLPLALAITADETYPKALGRWINLEGEETTIDIELLPHGKIKQREPDPTLLFERWELTGTDNQIALIGKLFLPPARIKPEALTSKRGLSEQEREQFIADSIAARARRPRAFTTQATIGIEREHYTMTITQGKQVSKLYRAD